MARTPLFAFLLLLPLILAFAQMATAQPNGASTQRCVYNISSSGAYNISPKTCSAFAVNLAGEVKNTAVVCKNTSIASISADSFDVNDTFYNCVFQQGSKITIQNNSKINLISPVGTPAIQVNGSNASATVGYTLRVNVFEPYGYNSTSVFGSEPYNRVAGFGYLLPLLGGKITLNESQLTPEPSFLPKLNETLRNISKIVPFGVYNQSQTQINYSEENLSFGKIVGSKTFPVATYTVFDNRTVNYNPYKLVYSFFAFDQLIFFNLTITKDINLTPVYVQPLFPQFNFYTIPNNKTENLTIKWLVAVPPPDYNWNFTTLLYRYTTNAGFTVNPIGAQLNPHSALVKVLQAPNESYQFSMANSTRFYFINYTSKLPVGLNSSITMTLGNAGKNITYLQDSTTPSFGHGVSFCSVTADSPFLVPTISYPGYYDFVPALRPFMNNSPVLTNGACNIGVYVTGKNIYLNCNGSIINNYISGIYLDGARNVTINDCRLYGNGISFNNATGVKVYNTTMEPSYYNDTFAVKSVDSSNIGLYNVSIVVGYADKYIILNSSNVTLDTREISSENLSQTTTTIPQQTTTSKSIKVYDYALYASTIIVISVYFMLYRISKRRRARRGASKRRR